MKKNFKVCLKKLGKIKHGPKMVNLGASKLGIMEDQGAQAPSWIHACDEVKFTESRKFMHYFLGSLFHR